MTKPFSALAGDGDKRKNRTGNGVLGKRQVAVFRRVAGAS